MLYICNLYNIVNQLYFNFEKKKKVDVQGLKKTSRATEPLNGMQCGE